jgi:hypothetical protein
MSWPDDKCVLSVCWQQFIGCAVPRLDYLLKATNEERPIIQSMVDLEKYFQNIILKSTPLYHGRLINCSVDWLIDWLIEFSASFLSKEWTQCTAISSFTVGVLFVHFKMACHARFSVKRKQPSWPGNALRKRNQNVKTGQNCLKGSMTSCSQL